MLGVSLKGLACGVPALRRSGLPVSAAEFKAGGSFEVLARPTVNKKLADQPMRLQVSTEQIKYFSPQQSHLAVSIAAIEAVKLQGLSRHPPGPNATNISLERDLTKVRLFVTPRPDGRLNVRYSESSPQGSVVFEGTLVHRAVSR